MINHPVLATIVGCWVLAALAGGMPAPNSTSGLGYRWLYGSLNILAANLEAVARARFPAAPLPAPKDPDAGPSQASL